MPLRLLRSPATARLVIARRSVVLLVMACIGWWVPSSSLVAEAQADEATPPSWQAPRCASSAEPFRQPEEGNKVQKRLASHQRLGESRVAGIAAPAVQGRTAPAGAIPPEIADSPSTNGVPSASAFDDPFGDRDCGGLHPGSRFASDHCRALEDGSYDGEGPCGSGYAPCWGRGDPSWQPLFQGPVEVRAEYLMWWGKGDPVPPLMTTSPADTPRDAAGLLTTSGTQILFGDSGLNRTMHSGGRFTLDFWSCPYCCSAIEASYFFLGTQSDIFRNSSQGTPILARPFFNVQDDRPDAGLIAFPGVQTGSITAVSSSSFQGTEILLRRNLVRQPGSKVDVLVGYRYLRLKDDLRMDEFETFIDPQSVIQVGSTLAITDSFDTLNQFHGVDLGIDAQWRRCCWSLDLVAKLALGNTNSHVSIGGTTTATVPDTAPVVSQGGFLAQQTNSGQFSRNWFSMVPELGATIGYDLDCRRRITVGYSLVYWSKVARPGDQIDLNLNPAQFPAPQASTGRGPEFRFATTDFWAQGLNLGLDIRF